MVELSAEKFIENITSDPLWAKKLDSPVKITTYCDLSYSGIYCLSPFLIFSGRDGSGKVANFSHCPNLTEACGTFEGSVNFQGSAVEKITKLKVTSPDNKGFSAIFRGCIDLKTASGIYNGFVNFGHSGIEKIKDLHILNGNSSNYAAAFSHCYNLKVATGNYPGAVTFNKSGVEEIKDLYIQKPENSTQTAVFFTDCKLLKVATGTYPGFADFRASGVEKIENLEIHGYDDMGASASFADCRKLKIASGVYYGTVDFYNSSIEGIKNLFIHLGVKSKLCPRNKVKYPQYKATFKSCNKLKHIDFGDSKTLSPKIIEKPNTKTDKKALINNTNLEIKDLELDKTLDRRIKIILKIIQGKNSLGNDQTQLKELGL